MILYVRYNLHKESIIPLYYIRLSQISEQLYRYLTLDDDEFALIHSLQVWELDHIQNQTIEFNRAAGMCGLSRETRGQWHGCSSCKLRNTCTGCQ